MKSTFVSDEKYILCGKPQFTVGRKDADIVIGTADGADTSVSRHHAILIPIPGQLMVIDQSKYGVYINEFETANAIPQDVQVEVKHGDQIRFGRLQNKWRVECVEYKITTSKLTPNEKFELQTIIEPFDGVLVDDWDNDCTHLVMTGVEFTFKALKAMVKGIPIVNLAFFKDTLANVRANVTLPNEEDYIPPIIDQCLAVHQSMMNVNIARSHLFAGKTFVFVYQEQQREYEPLIKLAQGNCRNLGRSTRRAFLLDENIILVKHCPSAESQITPRIIQLENYLASHDKRPIHKEEIAFAILYCSIEEHCNPYGEVPAVIRTIQTPQMENHESSNSAQTRRSVGRPRRTRSMASARSPKTEPESSTSSIGVVAQDAAQGGLLIGIEPTADGQLEQVPSTPNELNDNAIEPSSDQLIKDTKPLSNFNGVLLSQNLNIIPNSTPVAGKSAQMLGQLGYKKRVLDLNDNENDENLPESKKHKCDANQTSEDAGNEINDLFPYEGSDTSAGDHSQPARSTPSPMCAPPVYQMEFITSPSLPTEGWAKKEDRNQNHTLKKADDEVQTSEEDIDEIYGRCETSTQGTFSFGQSFRLITSQPVLSKVISKVD